MVVLKKGEVMQINLKAILSLSLLVIIGLFTALGTNFGENKNQLVSSVVKQDNSKYIITQLSTGSQTNAYNISSNSGISVKSLKIGGP